MSWRVNRMMHPLLIQRPLVARVLLSLQLSSVRLLLHLLMVATVTLIILKIQCTSSLWVPLSHHRRQFEREAHIVLIILTLIQLVPLINHLWLLIQLSMMVLHTSIESCPCPMPMEIYHAHHHHHHHQHDHVSCIIQLLKIQASLGSCDKLWTTDDLIKYHCDTTNQQL